ncbi:sporulation protein YqfC [Natronobacillus azotifigens]|uniref:Sporulation protein YqfC n=1 Tax=Natronobacillus azotifigens TaxID=472978 RepID=A0A9J6REE5_9BACI|nr:sporulation protein YqfC [Natronobacillus azotifigens]MCZ0704024.1 sporulation protein YqfC [Natronobacillus azotifigens]
MLDRRGGIKVKKWQQHVNTWLTNHLKLPSDVLLELPRITTIGHFHAYVENHRGLMLFSDQEVRLKLVNGSLVIKGNDLVIKTLLPEEILIEGKISGIDFAPQS